MRHHIGEHREVKHASQTAADAGASYIGTSLPVSGDAVDRVLRA